MASPKPAFGCCLSSPSAPHQNGCGLVEEEFEKAIRGRKVKAMNAADLATFLINTQCEKSMTEDRATTLMTDFNRVVMKSDSSRHFRIPGFSGSSRLSRSSRHATPAPEQPPTFDFPTFLRFLWHPDFNGPQAAKSSTVSIKLSLALVVSYLSSLLIYCRQPWRVVGAVHIVAFFYRRAVQRFLDLVDCFCNFDLSICLKFVSANGWYE